MTTTRMIYAVALLMSAAMSNAASLTLVYTGQNAIVDGVVQAEVGDALTFDLIMDFSDTFILDGEEVSSITLGGGFGVVFDSGVLTFADYDSADLGDESFRRDPDIADGVLSGGGFGSFDGLTGPDLVASITFVAAAQGDVSIDITPGGPLTGLFISALDFPAIVPVDYRSIEVAVVPVPAAVWFLLSGLGVLAGAGRTRR